VCWLATLWLHFVCGLGGGGDEVEKSIGFFLVGGGGGGGRRLKKVLDFVWTFSFLFTATVWWTLRREFPIL
jgi:hypothetical protein